MRERLLDYLFGQLSLHERSEIEAELARDPQLRAELARLRACAQPSDEAGQLEPPRGLAERTCRYVAQASPAAVAGQYVISSSTWRRGPWSRDSRWSLTDLSLAACAVLAVAMLLLPAMQESRCLARRHQCSAKLQALAEAFLAYAGMRNNEFPLLPPTGKLAVGGSVPQQLVEAQVLDAGHAAQLVVCPGSELAQQLRSECWLVRIPSRQELLRAEGPQLVRLQRTMGGSFGFRGGYVIQGKYRAVRLDYNSKRSPIVADGPSPYLTDFQSDNHGGGGLNVLFADGHVEFVSGCSVLRCGDKLFLNRVNLRAPGCDVTDAVLFGSADPLNYHCLVKIREP